jgi:hypothetical protein
LNVQLGEANEGCAPCSEAHTKLCTTQKRVLAVSDTEGHTCNYTTQSTTQPGTHVYVTGMRTCVLIWFVCKCAHMCACKCCVLYVTCTLRTHCVLGNCDETTPTATPLTPNEKVRIAPSCAFARRGQFDGLAQMEPELCGAGRLKPSSSARSIPPFRTDSTHTKPPTKQHTISHTC